MRFVLVLMLCLLSGRILSCDCKSISKEKEFLTSDGVFIGKIIEISSEYIKVDIKEVFKGTELDVIYLLDGSCSILPKLGQTWLLYANKEKNDCFRVSHCGWSRSFDYPISIMNENIPEPLAPGESIDNSLVFLDIKKASIELKEDIIQLRIKREENTKQKQRYFFGVSLIIILISILIFRSVWYRG